MFADGVGNKNEGVGNIAKGVGKLAEGVGKRKQQRKRGAHPNPCSRNKRNAYPLFRHQFYPESLGRYGING